jgi:hypothetical protein
MNGNQFFCDMQEKIFFMDKIYKLGTMALVYNPSYLEGRDWEDRGLRPTQAKSSRDPISVSSL